MEAAPHEPGARATRPLAINLRRWRLERRLSLSELARQAGLSKSTLSELEHARGNPSLDTLWSLANALAIPFAFLFDEAEAGPPVQLVKLADAPVVGAEGLNVITQRLASRGPTGQLELNLISLAAGKRREAQPHSPGLIEHVIVLSGVVNAGPDDASFCVEPGDLLTFPADRPHHYEAVGEPARLIVIHEYPPVVLSGSR